MKYLIMIFAATVVLTLAGWRFGATRNPQSHDRAILIDLSLSNQDACESVGALARFAIQTDLASSNAVLVVEVIGDGSTNNEPRILATYQIPKTHRVLEGQHAGERNTRALLSDLNSRCLSLRRPLSSPIYIGVKRAIEDLRARGCTEQADCRLFVASDLEENVEPSIKQAINEPEKTIGHLPSPMSNRGIATTLCGFAMVAGSIKDPSGREIRKSHPHDHRYGDRLQLVWSALFTEPVLLQPYCPAPALGGSAEKAQLH